MISRYRVYKMGVLFLFTVGVAATYLGLDNLMYFADALSIIIYTAGMFVTMIGGYLIVRGD
tara:strand:- start:141 stop:323 length:183 start_codon:yes stop_codon:yes gene_type:complete